MSLNLKIWESFCFSKAQFQVSGPINNFKVVIEHHHPLHPVLIYIIELTGKMDACLKVQHLFGTDTKLDCSYL